MILSILAEIQMVLSWQSLSTIAAQLYRPTVRAWSVVVAGLFKTQLLLWSPPITPDRAVTRINSRFATEKSYLSSGYCCQCQIGMKESPGNSTDTY